MKTDPSALKQRGIAMAFIRDRLTAFLDQQHRLPNGLIGRLIGERMAHQHAPETLWTLELLQLSRGERVLELGCGAGHALPRVAQAVEPGYVVGLDLSPTMIGVAQQRNRARIKAGEVALLQGDVAAPAIADRRFDKIFSIHTFYFWPDPLSIFKQLSGMLRANGLLVVTLCNGRISMAGKRTYWELHARLQEQIVPKLPQLGFTSVTLQQGPDSRQYMSVALVAQKSSLDLESGD